MGHPIEVSILVTVEILDSVITRRFAPRGGRGDRPYISQRTNASAATHLQLFLAARVLFEKE